MTSAPESWRAVPGYVGLYEVSDHGHVRSLTRLDSRGNRVWGRILKPGVQQSGHLRVTLCQNGRITRHFVHRLVLEAFVGPPPAGMEACHRDGDPTNNNVGNLRWDTKSANAQDRLRHGNDRNARKTHCPKEHEYSPDNTYYGASGGRHCKICFLAWARRNKDQINATRRRRYASRKVA